MEENIPEIVEKASKTWLDAADTLAIRVTAPFAISTGGENIQCIAFVHDFGSAKGTIVGAWIPGTLQTDTRLKDYAKQNGFFWAFVNPLGWLEYSEARFKEALEDWGYYGEQDKCPAWFKGFKYGRALP